MEFFRLEGVSFPTRGDLLVLGIKAESLGSPALAGRFLTTTPPGKDTYTYIYILFRILFPYRLVCALNS